MLVDKNDQAKASDVKPPPLLLLEMYGGCDEHALVCQIEPPSWSTRMHRESTKRKKKLREATEAAHAKWDEDKKKKDASVGRN